MKPKNVDKNCYETNQNFMKQLFDLMSCFYETYQVNDLANQAIRIMDEVIQKKVFYVPRGSQDDDEVEGQDEVEGSGLG